MVAGITDDNRDEVKWCVQTSSMEKRIRNAARGMFSVMNTAHKEVLSKDEYILAVKKMAGGDKIEEKLLLAAGIIDGMFECSLLLHSMHKMDFTVMQVEV